MTPTLSARCLIRIEGFNCPAYVIAVHTHKFDVRLVDRGRVMIGIPNNCFRKG